MAHSLNNADKADYLKRTGKHSTKGSRRGFVDDGVEVKQTDQNREALSHQLGLLQADLRRCRQALGLAKHQKLSQFTPPKNQQHVFQHALDLVEQMDALYAEIQSIKPRQASEWTHYRLNVWETLHPDMVEAVNNIARAQMARDSEGRSDESDQIRDTSPDSRQ